MYQCYCNVQLLNRSVVVDNLAWEEVNIHIILYSPGTKLIKEAVSFMK